MILEFSDHRSFLKAVLAKRTRDNPSYSLRGFSKQLGVAHTSLRDVMLGRKNFSPARALKLARKLGMGGEESEYFCLLVQLGSTQDPEFREQLQRRALSFHPTAQTHDLSVDVFRAISDWHHVAILELTCIDGFVMTPRNIGKRIGIPAVEAEIALERLVRLDLLEEIEPGKLRKRNPKLIARAHESEAAIKKFNRQMLEKAVESLENQKFPERWGATETFPVKRSDVAEIRKKIDQFLSDVTRYCERTGPKTDVYHLNVQLFNLTRKKEK